MDTWDKFGCDPDGKLVMYDDDKHYIPYVHYEDMVHAIKHLPSAQPSVSKTEMVGDVISRQAAIDAITQYLGRIKRDFKQWEGTARIILDHVPSAQPGWISCKTALPEHDGEYLVTIKAFAPDQVVHTDIDIARFTDGKWRKGFPVTAWCELPKPWEGENA